MPNIIKIFFLVIFFVISACSYSNTNKFKTQQSLTTPSNKEFIEDYNSVTHDGLIIYKKQQISEVYKKLIDKKMLYMPNKNEVFNIMNAPFLLKKEYSSEMWQYRSSNCIIVFLWNLSNNHNTVNTIYAYNHQMVAVDYTECIVKYVKENKLS